ncbi:unnamed protein product [Rotaria sp. Silwood2]|nr:unnamed protein product [Rotaria sp. Silwood2]
MKSRIVTARSCLGMKIILTFFFLIIIYLCSQLVKSSKLERNSIKLSYLQLLREKRAVNEKKLAPYNSIVGIASSNAAAYSNGNDSYISYEDSYLYGIYMGIKWQCVEYARRWTFLRKSSIFESVNGANDIWNQIKYIERVIDKEKFPLKKYSNGCPIRPINESYLIYPIQKDMPYGHVAVIVDVLQNSIRIAEQNFYFNYWTKNYSREIPYQFINGLYYIQDIYDIYGWMQIDDQQQLKSLDNLTIEKIQMRNEKILDVTSSSQLTSRIYYFLVFSVLFISQFKFDEYIFL